MDVTRTKINDDPMRDPKKPKLKLKGDSHTGGFGGNCPPGQTYSQSKGICIK
tara:strand:- start:10 stop:165 length:156 start_codon:yes stop_codon:yes gene_type:complete